MKIRENDTIGAIATPVGEGAIAVIRVSGPDAIRIVDRVFTGRKKLIDAVANTVHFGRVIDANGLMVDEVLAAVFRAPHSYTGEDAVEINCHGGVYVANRILEAVLTSGARQADPGEYTKRAFLNGRIDLSQAEAVGDLIRARSEKAHWASLAQLEGKLSGFVGSLKSELLHLCALLELDLDFTEEGIAIVENSEVRRLVVKVQESLSELVRSYAVGRHYRDGVAVVLVGKPNAGKSSLFNVLLRENRAIVSPSPGTTRDYIEESVVLGGVLFRLVDTAGLREAVEWVETEGVRRTKSKLAQSDVVVIVVDSTESLNRKDALKAIHGLNASDEVIIAYNKIDLLQNCQARSDEFWFNGVRGAEVFLSAKTGAGVDVLTRLLMQCVVDDTAVTSADFRVTSRRHVEACEHAKESLDRALAAIDNGMTNEFVALDIRQAIDSLSEIAGEVTTDEVLGEIFSNFCIGK